VKADPVRRNVAERVVQDLDANRGLAQEAGLVEVPVHHVAAQAEIRRIDL
jgi:hypothetical protein